MYHRSPDYYIVAIVVAILTVSVMSERSLPFIGSQSNEYEPVNAEDPRRQKEIAVTVGSYQNYYALGKDVNESFLITAIAPTSRGNAPIPDAHSEFVTFTPRATKLYLEKYPGQSHCPARFLNRYAEHISLYAANTQIAEKLAHWKQINGSDVKQWQVVNIKGQCLGERSKIEKNGEDVTQSTRIIQFGRKASRKCHRILVNDIDHLNSSLKDYVQGQL